MLFKTIRVMGLGLGERADLTYRRFLREEKKNLKHRESTIEMGISNSALKWKAVLGFYRDHS